MSLSARRSPAVPSWLHYAMAELRQAFSLGDKGARRNRDFLWICAVFVLLIGMLAASSAMYRGLVINFADSLLGYQPGAGIPVRIVFDTGMSTGDELRAVSSLFRNSAEIGGAADPPDASTVKGYDFHPFFDVEAGGVFRLPENTWDARDENVAFTGWAVSENSPLWRQIAGEGGDVATRIVASRAAFAAAFDREAYEEALSKLIADRLFKDWRMENPAGQPLRSLYLEIPYTYGKFRYQKFDISWVSSFPSVQRIAFLAPLRTYGPLDRALRDPLFWLIPGTVLDEKAGFITRIHFEDVDGLASDVLESRLAGFRTCVGTASELEVERTTFDLSIRFAVPADARVLSPCIEGLTRDTDIYVQEYPFLPTLPILRVASDAMFFLCETVSSNLAEQRPELEGCLRGAERVTIPLMDGVSSGFAYVPERGGIDAFVEAVDAAQVSGRKALFISELYRNSIMRFRYLVSALEYLGVPMAIFFGFIAIYSLLTNISMFFSSRHTHYGVLMARGMSPVEIWKIIGLQFSFCLTMATIVSFVVLVIFKILLQMSFAGSSAFRLAVDELGIQAPMIVDVPDLKDGDSIWQAFVRSAADTSLGLVVVVAMLIGILVYKLYAMPVRRSTFPMQLIASSD